MAEDDELDLAEASTQGVQLAHQHGHHGDQAREFAAGFDAAAATRAAELEAAAAIIGWDETLRCAQACGQRDVDTWVRTFRSLVTSRH